MAYSDTFIAFRFLSLTPAERDSLLRLSSDIESRPARGIEGRVTGIFALNEGVDYGWIGRFITEHNISKTDYGLFISISTSRDSDLVRVPDFATDLFRVLGGVIDFSFTSISEDDE
jgi:hypothetical protein